MSLSDIVLNCRKYHNDKILVVCDNMTEIYKLRAIIDADFILKAQYDFFNDESYRRVFATDKVLSARFSLYKQ